MKRITAVIILTFSLCSFGQVYYGYELKNGLKLYNGSITVVSDSLGITFIGENGKKYHQYFKGIQKIDNGLIHICSRRGWGDDMGCMDFYIIPFIKIVAEIEEYSNSCSVNSHYYSTYHGNDNSDSWGFISEFGKIKYFSACKNGKYARVNKYGKVLTEFKYDNSSCNSYTELDENNIPQKTYVILDEKGTELFKTKEFIHKFWDLNSYLTEDLENKIVYLTYKNKKYKIEEDLKEHLIELGLPYESDIFIGGECANCDCDDNDKVYGDGYSCGNRWFYIIKRGKIILKQKNFRPETRFYKNHCIVSEKKGGKRIYHIINNKLKIVNSLSDKNLIVGTENFDENGLSIVGVLKTKEEDEFYRVYKYGLIDYNGNIILPMEYKTIYNVENLYFTQKYDEDGRYLRDESGYFNKEGKRVEDEENFFDY